MPWHCAGCHTRRFVASHPFRGEFGAVHTITGPLGFFDHEGIDILIMLVVARADRSCAQSGRSLVNGMLNESAECG